jgi:hypothetical protein
MEKNKIIENYRKVAMDILNDRLDRFEISIGHLEVKHMAELGASIMLTRDGILQGGSLVKAVVDNDLYGAIARADTTVIKGVKYFLQLREYVYFNELVNLIK